MIAKIVAVTVLAAFGASFLPAGDAEARHRLKWREWRFDPDFGFYRPEPRYIPYPAYEFEDDYEEEYFDPPRRYSYAPEYYEPEYAPPPRKRRPATALRAPAEPPAAKPKPKLISCKKAAGIVSGFGFDAVKATGCKGKSYAFSATRDGKRYAITVNPANGELTKVKKL
jgi:hypothetical protein